MGTTTKGAEMNAIYLDDEAFDMLARAGVPQSRINAMRETRDAALKMEEAA